MNKRYDAEKSKRLKERWGDKYYLHWNDDLLNVQKEVPKGVDKSNWLEQGNDACNG